MKKILCLVGPFNLEQVAYVYEDGNKLDVAKFNIDNSSEVLENLIAEYNIENVEFKGPHQFSKGLWNNFTTYTKNKYSIDNMREVKVTYL